MPKVYKYDQLREKYYQKGIKEVREAEQKRLNDIFSILGDLSNGNDPLYFLNLDYEIHKIKSGIESGNREAMLVFIQVVADSLLAFEVLPKEIRKSLAYRLKHIIINLYESEGFLPIGRGKTSKKKERKLNNKAYWTALSVEQCRFYEGCTLEEAIENISQKKGLTESLVEKRWRKGKKEARKTLEMLSIITNRPKMQVPSKPRRKR